MSVQFSRFGLQNVAAGQDANGFARGEVGAVGGNAKEAIAFCDGGEIAGALPADRDDGGRVVRPSEFRGQEMGKAGFLAEGFAEMGFKKSEWCRFGAGK